MPFAAARAEALFIPLHRAAAFAHVRLHQRDQLITVMLELLVADPGDVAELGQRRWARVAMPSIVESRGVGHRRDPGGCSDRDAEHTSSKCWIVSIQNRPVE